MFVECVLVEPKCAFDGYKEVSSEVAEQMINGIIKETYLDLLKCW